MGQWSVRGVGNQLCWPWHTAVLKCQWTPIWMTYLSTNDVIIGRCNYVNDAPLSSMFSADKTAVYAGNCVISWCTKTAHDAHKCSLCTTKNGAARAPGFDHCFDLAARPRVNQAAADLSLSQHGNSTSTTQLFSYWFDFRFNTWNNRIYSAKRWDNDDEQRRQRRPNKQFCWVTSCRPNSWHDVRSSG